jgi:hypothetical protein
MITGDEIAGLDTRIDNGDGLLFFAPWSAHTAAQ